MGFRTTTMNKANGSDGIRVELIRILCIDSMKGLHSMCQLIWKTEQWPQDWKKSFFHSNFKERECQRIFKTVQLWSFHMLAR